MTGSISVSETARRSAWPAGVAGALIAALLMLATGERPARIVFDAWQRASPRDLSASPVAVVLIDPEALKAVGPWPWPRYHLARLTETIAVQKPKAIGYDMIFAEPDRLNPDQFAGLYPELDAGAGAAVRALPTMDAVFADALGRAPAVLGRAAVGAGGRDPAQLFVDAQMTGAPPPRTPAYPQLLASIDALEDVALGHGLLNGPPDADGMVRHVPLVIRAGERAMPGMALELARVADGAAAIGLARSEVRMGNRRIPDDAAGRMALRFGVFPDDHVFSAADVLRRDFPANAFRGRIVLIGLGAEGTADVVATPLAREGYGVFVQAQAADAILRGGWLARPRWAAWLEWGTGALLAALVIATSGRRRWPAFAALALAALLPLVSWLAFTRGLLLDPVRPAAVGAGAAAGAALLLFARTRIERARLAALLLSERLAAARTEGELQAARTIQFGMLPDAARLAALDPRLDVAALLEPARSVGGDFFDAFRIDAARTLFAVGDVTGKGVPAALFMALSKALSKSILARADGDLGAGVARLNAELLAEAGDETGVTMLFALLDSATGDLDLVSAGHDNPILAGADGARVLALDGGPPLGIVDFDYPVERHSLAPGQAIVLITDGVTEAHDPAGALFGTARTAAAARGPDAGSIAAAVRDAVRGFEAGGEPGDDLTVLAIRRR